MFVIPSPNEVVISSDLSDGLGRRLPCYNTSENIIFANGEGRSLIAETRDAIEENSAGNIKANPKQHGKKAQREGESRAKKKLTLEELRRTSPPGFKEFEAAIGSQDLDEEIALLLWEDIFKPLDSFELLNIGSGH